MQTPAATSGAAYPAPPWFLTGTMTFSLFSVPARAVPELTAHPPRGHRPVSLGRHALVGLAVARYELGCDLSYDELLVAVLTRRGLALRVTVTQIWVDSPASQAGGRALWAIPKALATTTRSARAHSGERTEFRTLDGAPIARLDRRPGRRLPPSRVSVPLTTAQREDPVAPRQHYATAVTAHNTVTATVRTASAHWEVAVDGPLGWLTGRRPLATFTLTDANLTFGTRVDRST
ncbi:acetoacetate decarboxylase [Flavimobilis marinus]|uniref:Acetoacetate decarboxylase (ADC) n=1 Tax=Flavimobilis marinus TaxID=285351 RepID=A0A1I2I3Y1_9MICO|nr:acetoacetate decarboxylase family protein [Flavimobilis marinus]GHG48258.1 acetoacetate decarboxylase [Flavimobilis marinus]SFF35221.1 Acetoacetate decarboxylase (ADC) [Flavimobilis marinus]